MLNEAHLYVVPVALRWYHEMKEGGRGLTLAMYEGPHAATVGGSRQRMHPYTKHTTKRVDHMPIRSSHTLDTYSNPLVVTLYAAAERPVAYYEETNRKTLLGLLDIPPECMYRRHKVHCNLQQAYLEL